MRFFPAMSTLTLYTNNFTGNINFLQSLSQLQILDLNSNALSGDVSFLANVTNLLWLILDNNMLRGNVNMLSKLEQLTILSVRNNSLTGTLPLTVHETLNTLDLSQNRIECAESTISISYPHLQYLNISNNNIQNCHLGAFDLRAPAISDLSANSFVCQFPPSPQEVLVFASACTPEPAFVIGIVIASAIFLVILIFLFCYGRCKQIILLTSTVRKSLFLFKWASGTFDITMDVLFMSSIIKSSSDTRGCSALNQKSVLSCPHPFIMFFSSFIRCFDIYIYGRGVFERSVLNLPPEETNIGYTTFAEYIKQQSSMEDSVQNAIDLFAQSCNGVAGCRYQPSLYECSGDGHHVFLRLIWISIGLYALKEFVKSFVIMYSLKRGFVPVRLRLFVGTSLVSPLLCFNPVLLHSVVQHQPSVCELLSTFWYEGVMENFPQLALYVYYNTFLVPLGLGLTGMTAISVTIVSSCVLLMMALRLLMLAYIFYKQDFLIFLC
mmetsp:Transcript_39547/g.77796  ORF Transcript_39547/g.77796 Transcript_39547/m.77796 type:complete len:494 (+) Transcript_39547:105-1586(+)